MSGRAAGGQGGPGVCLGIVLYRNAPEELARLCASLGWNREALGGEGFRVMWLDNSPTDALREVVERLWPGADYRASGANLGFGAAHNRMMAEAFASPAVRAYVCVNPDAVLHPHCIRELVAELERAPAGLVEARTFPDEHPKPYDARTHETPWCCGCVLLVSRELYTRIGGFDERFFMYCEDVDLSWRARGAGFSIRVAPGALAHHYTVDRELTPAREQSVRKSAALLGAKYGNAAFTEARLREYEALGGPAFPAPAIQRPERRVAGVVDFDHLFEFSRGRW